MIAALRSLAAAVARYAVCLVPVVVWYVGPDPRDVALVSGGAAVGLLVGLRVKHRRYLTLREEKAKQDARIAAWNGQANRTDLDEVGPITGEHPAVDLYDGDAEVVLCSWCPESATARIDIHCPDGHVARDLPACDEHRDAARYGDVDVADAVPDMASSAYGRRLG